MIRLRSVLFLCPLFFYQLVKAQKIESIHVNLYTDSLKKGTYNYINIDGLLSNGKYVPLDSTQLLFSSSYGTFYGNSLYIDPECKTDKISIHVSMKKEPFLQKDIVMYIKKKEDNQRLPTVDELFDKKKKDKN